MFEFLSKGGWLADILGLAVVLLLIAGVYFKGKTDAEIACAGTAGKGLISSVKQYGQIEKDSLGRSESDTDKYLLKWLRD